MFLHCTHQYLSENIRTHVHTHVIDSAKTGLTAHSISFYEFDGTYVTHLMSKVYNYKFDTNCALPRTNNVANFR